MTHLPKQTAGVFALSLATVGFAPGCRDNHQNSEATKGGDTRAFDAPPALDHATMSRRGQVERENGLESRLTSFFDSLASLNVLTLSATNDGASRPRGYLNEGPNARALAEQEFKEELARAREELVTTEASILAQAGDLVKAKQTREPALEEVEASEQHCRKKAARIEARIKDLDLVLKAAKVEQQQLWNSQSGSSLTNQIEAQGAQTKQAVAMHDWSRLQPERNANREFLTFLLEVKAVLTGATPSLEAQAALIKRHEPLLRGAEAPPSDRQSFEALMQGAARQAAREYNAQLDLQGGSEREPTQKEKAVDEAFEQLLNNSGLKRPWEQ